MGATSLIATQTNMIWKEVLVEWELSPHYIVGTTSYVNEVSRTVYRSDFQFSGKELVSGTVSEVI